MQHEFHFLQMLLVEMKKTLQLSVIRHHAPFPRLRFELQRKNVNAISRRKLVGSSGIKQDESPIEPLEALCMKLHPTEVAGGAP